MRVDASLHLLQSRDVRDVVVPPLPLLLLQLDGDAAHGAPLQPLHQVGDKPGNLIIISALAFHPGISSRESRFLSCRDHVYKMSRVKDGFDIGTILGSVGRSLCNQ